MPNSGYVDNNTGESRVPDPANQQYCQHQHARQHAGSKYSALNVKFQTQNLGSHGPEYCRELHLVALLRRPELDLRRQLAGRLRLYRFLGLHVVSNPQLDWGTVRFRSSANASHWLPSGTPWFKHGTGIEREVLGGWNISGIFTARSGVPFSVYDDSNDETYYTVPRLTPATPFPVTMSARARRRSAPTCSMA